MTREEKDYEILSVYLANGKSAAIVHAKDLYGYQSWSPAIAKLNMILREAGEPTV